MQRVFNSLNYSINCQQLHFFKYDLEHVKISQDTTNKVPAINKRRFKYLRSQSRLISIKVSVIRYRAYNNLFGHDHAILRKCSV